MAKKKEVQEREEYADNQVLLICVGACNDNLKILEKKLGVDIKTRGNQVTIKGEEEVVKQAFFVMEKLYQTAKKKGSVDLSDIDNALYMCEGKVIMSEQKETTTTTTTGDQNLALKTPKRHIQPRTQTQADYISAMRDFEMVFGLGPAGTGKTFLAVAKAVSLMTEGKIDKIILSRPAVEAGENLGFLPGDLKEKIDPYLRPLYDALYDMLPRDVVDKKLELGEIEVAPLAFMRGRTLTNAMVILDEAQNTTPMQMKMFLTRMGENSRMVINGDLSQTDLPKGVQSGLGDALDVLRNVKDIGIIAFSEKDVVRHGLVSSIVKAYDKRYASRKGLVG